MSNDSLELNLDITNTNIKSHYATIYEFLEANYSTDKLNNIKKLLCWSSDDNYYMKLGANISTILPNIVEIKLRNIILDDSDLLKCDGITWLELSSVKCTNIIFSDLVNLEYFYNDTNISNLDLLNFQNLLEIMIDNTDLRAIDLSHCPKLISADIKNTPLKKIDFTANVQLRKLVLNNNKNLTEIQINTCDKLEYVVIANNNITNLDLPNCPLDYLNLNENTLAEIDFSKCSNLIDLSIRKNNFQSIECLFALKKLRYLDIRENPVVFDMSDLLNNLPKLTNLYVDPAQIGLPRFINIHRHHEDSDDESDEDSDYDDGSNKN
jgi:uncharacterized protein YjbI with pentapeptide repeats